MSVPAHNPCTGTVLHRPDIPYFDGINIDTQSGLFGFPSRLGQIIPRSVSMVGILGHLFCLHPDGDIEVFIIFRHPSEVRVEFHIVRIVRLNSCGAPEEHHILARASTLR